MPLIDFTMKNRPAGMPITGERFEFNPYVLNLGFEHVEGITSSRDLPGRGSGIVEVPYADATATAGRGTLSVPLHRRQ